MEILAGVLAKHDPASAGRRGESGQGGLGPHLNLPRSSGSPQLLNAVGVHGGASATAAQVATAGAEGIRTLDSDLIAANQRRQDAYKRIDELIAHLDQLDAQLLEVGE